MRMRVVSWNIWLGKYLPQVLDFLREQNADIVGLQELEADTTRDQAGYIARELGYQHVFFPAFEGEVDTGKGEAVLSKFPILSSARHFLSPSVDYDGTPTTEPRIVAEATLSLGDSTLTVYSTHLAYAANFRPSQPRTVQAATLVSLVRSRRRVVLMGDLNALPESDVVHTLCSALTHADSNLSTPTFTMYPHEYEDHKTDELTARVDYIFTSPDIDVVDAGVGMSRGSNHLPVWAILAV